MDPIMERNIREVMDAGGFVQRAPGMANHLAVTPGRWEDFDPFLIMAEDKFRVPGGFPDHPHRGIETVTLVLDGELRHADNRGNSGVLGAGDVQWMTAGRGIIHAELPHQSSTVHSLQLWVNLPARNKMTESGYQDLRAGTVPIATEPGVSIRVISGDLEGMDATTHNHVPIGYFDATMEAGARTSLAIPASHNGFVYVIEGSARFGTAETPARAGQTLWLDVPSQRTGRSRLPVYAEQASRFLVVTGEPLGEPVVAYGPFVMNTPDEIVAAYEDYQAGRFGGPTPAALELQGAH
jgi:quercetin 2,3-dioxygenase